MLPVLFLRISWICLRKLFYVGAYTLNFLQSLNWVSADHKSITNVFSWNSKSRQTFDSRSCLRVLLIMLIRICPVRLRIARSEFVDLFDLIIHKASVDSLYGSKEKIQPFVTLSIVAVLMKSFYTNFVIYIRNSILLEDLWHSLQKHFSILSIKNTTKLQLLEMILTLSVLWKIAMYSATVNKWINNKNDRFKQIISHFLFNDKNL